MSQKISKEEREELLNPKTALGRELFDTNEKLIKANQALAESNLKLLKANEELKELDNLKSSILSSASHHLQNPLQDIVMGTSMLLDGSFGSISKEAKTAISHLSEAARHLTITFKMWMKVLDFENGKVDFYKEVFNLKDLVKGIMSTWEELAERRSLEFVLDCKEDVKIQADKKWIKEVIMNLVDNAFKMTDKGSVKISIKTKNDSVLISVSDTGVGMSENTLSHLFNKFEKGKEGWKRDMFGTGLGLYLCKKIIEEGHDGKIYASSLGEGKGAVFFVELPK